MVEKIISETQTNIDKNKISPNENCFHIFKIIAHAGNHSNECKGVLKFEIEKYLTKKKFQFYSDM